MDSERRLDSRPRACQAAGDQVLWLDASKMSISLDCHGKLMLRMGACLPMEVQPAKLFALSEPDGFIAFCDSEGEELGVLRDAGGLDPASQAKLAEYLERKYFIPVIKKVLRIEEYFIDQTWTVVTDRGSRTFTIQGRDSVRFLSDRGMLLMDMNDNRYLLEDRQLLDPVSRRLVDRFVW